MALADVFDQIPELPARKGIDAGCWLIENQQIRIVNQRTADTQLLLHSTGKLACRTIAKCCEASAREQFIDAPLALCLALTEEPSKEIDVLIDRERRI